jgi:hypothetical protein
MAAFLSLRESSFANSVLRFVRKRKLEARKFKQR